jgi:hypothetical protein
MEELRSILERHPGAIPPRAEPRDKQ